MSLTSAQQLASFVNDLKGEGLEGIKAAATPDNSLNWWYNT